MFRRLGILGVVLALFSLAGGHWAAMQAVAWAEMLRVYTAQTGSLTVAVAQTFDGEHPCELCRAIVAAKSKSSPGDPAASGLRDELKVKALLVATVVLPTGPAPVGASLPRRAAFFGPGRTDPPPTPPPRRSALAA